jgi:hypothetical protein
MSKRIYSAFAVTARKENRILRKKSRFARAKRFANASISHERIDGKVGN